MGKKERNREGERKRGGLEKEKMRGVRERVRKREGDRKSERNV
jgi:hypothetical protein